MLGLARRSHIRMGARRSLAGAQNHGSLGGRQVGTSDCLGIAEAALQADHQG